MMVFSGMDGIQTVYHVYILCILYVYIYILIICHIKIESKTIKSNLTECRLIYVSISALDTLYTYMIEY
jgi:hypothetical protein